jgi:hypothetical protein
MIEANRASAGVSRKALPTKAGLGPVLGSSALSVTRGWAVPAAIAAAAEVTAEADAASPLIDPLQSRVGELDARDPDGPCNTRKYAASAAPGFDPEPSQPKWLIRGQRGLPSVNGVAPDPPCGQGRVGLV